MELINYNFDFYNRFIDLYFDNGGSIQVTLNTSSGKIYKRPKIVALF